MAGAGGDGTPRPPGRSLHSVARMVKQLLPILVKDVVPPIAVYYVLHLLGANDWVALLGGVVGSGILMVLEAVRARRLDVFSGFMMAMFGAGLAASFVTGDPR